MKNQNTKEDSNLYNKKINNIIKEIKGIKDLIHQHHFEMQNAVRFILDDKQIAFKMWQMNIPNKGDDVEICFKENIDLYNYVSSVFKNRKLLKGNIETSYYFSFTVKSITHKIDYTGDFEADFFDYYVYLTPKLKKENRQIDYSIGS